MCSESLVASSYMNDRKAWYTSHTYHIRCHDAQPQFLLATPTGQALTLASILTVSPCARSRRAHCRVPAAVMSAVSFVDSLAASAPLQLFGWGQLPLAVSALVASHLPLVSLLRLQRCSSANYRLRNDDAYMSVAWHWAKLWLDVTGRLCDWTLPVLQCILEDESGPSLVPVRMWQAALPAFQAVLATAGEADARYHRLRELTRQPQRTKWTLARSDATGQHVVRDERGEQSADVEWVEVLADSDWAYMATVLLSSHHELDVRCPLVLQACPYLQHLHLVVDAHAHVMPSHGDTFALVPRLRSLYVIQDQKDDAKGQATETLCVDIEQMLSSLPQLTTLHCWHLRHFGVSELLEIASHSTLEEVRLHVDQHHLADEEWIGKQIRFPTSVDEDEIQLEQDAARMVFDGDIEEESDETAFVNLVNSSANGRLPHSANEQREPAWVRDDMQRFHAALARTQPTKRSCEVRLALADWLHRRLRRGKLRTDDHSSDSAHPQVAVAELSQAGGADAVDAAAAAEGVSGGSIVSERGCSPAAGSSSWTSGCERSDWTTDTLTQK